MIVVSFWLASAFSSVVWFGHWPTTCSAVVGWTGFAEQSLQLKEPGVAKDASFPHQDY